MVAAAPDVLITSYIINEVAARLGMGTRQCDLLLTLADALLFSFCFCCFGPLVFNRDVGQ